MPYITLQRLVIDNFKGCNHFDFTPAGEDRTIRGDNAAGKTTVYDALVWLLFGKDSRGRKDFDIKPLLPDGTVADHEAITSVEAELDVDGQELRLRRTYYEKWTTRRGRSEAVFDGHGSDYAVDDVPVTKGAFDQTVGGLVDEETFRALTDVTYFPEKMRRQDRRTMLFDLAGVMSDKEIMAESGRFDRLLEAAGEKSLEDYRKILTARRKELARAKTDIPARIDEQTRTVQELSKTDFAALREQRDKDAEQEEALKKELAALDTQDPAATLRTRQAELEAQRATLEAENLRHRAGQVSDTAGRDAIRRSIEDLTLAIDQKNASVKALERDMEHYKVKVEGYRMDWLAENAVEFDAPDTCPTCGQKLPKTRMEAARKSFEQAKAEKLRAIEAAGEEANDRIDRIHEQIETEKQAAAELFAKRNEREAELAAIPEAAPVEDLPDYAQRMAELERQLGELARQIVTAGEPKKNARRALIRKIDILHTGVGNMTDALALEGRLSAARQRIEELREQSRSASEALEELDGLLMDMEDFSRYKAGFVEDSINGMFQHAKFRLFREQINGGLEECCDVIYQGVPYGSLNNGARINIGIDIIRTIGSRQGVSVPLFIDNAEAVTELWDSGSQQIRLVVDAKAKELMME